MWCTPYPSYLQEDAKSAKLTYNLSDESDLAKMRHMVSAVPAACGILLTIQYSTSKTSDKHV